VLDEPRYLQSATRAARFVLASMKRPDGGLYRTARTGKAHLAAYLEDYAFLSDALVDLFEASGDAAFLDESARLAQRLIRDFGDDDNGGFYNTAESHEALLVRTRDGHDGAIPNPNAVAARALARLSAHLGREDHRERATRTLRAYGRSIERAPRAFATALAVADFLLEGPLEIVLAGTPGDDAYRRLAAVVRRRYLPNRVIAIALPDGGSPTALSEGKSPVGGKPTLYVCRNFVCQAPITDPRAAEEQLDQEVTERRKGRVRSLPAERLAGRASREGTERYASRFRASLGDAAYGPFGSTEWTVSRFGFGAYRVDDRSALHRAALEKALTSGVQLVDTSTNYADGHSEQLIGEVLARLTARGALFRSNS
jgi:hypothetical protein